MEPGLRFAGLLRQLRTEARLTQEELAEASGVCWAVGAGVVGAGEVCCGVALDACLRGLLLLADPSRRG